MFTTRPELSGTVGMVASTHWLASAVGMRTLEAGGNAFDAAAAAGFTLSVVEPHLNGPGGDAPILGHRAQDAHDFVICGQGTAPAAATIEAYRDLGLDLVPGTGHLAAVVPGAFGAWLDLLARYGTLPLADVLGPAIGYARDGYPLVPAAARTIATVADMFAEHWPTSAATYLTGGRVPEAGARFRNPQLADTFDRLLAAGGRRPREEQIEAARRAFYEGFVAEAVDAFQSGVAVQDSSGRPHTGLLRGDDLAAWRATEEPTTALRFAGRTVHKTGAWGQGPVLLQQLAVLESLGVEALLDDPVELVHTVVEVARLAFADREAWYGDVPDVPLDTLLSADYAASRARLVGPDAAEGLRPGSPDGRVPRLASALREARGSTALDEQTGVGEPTVSPIGLSPGDTCHVDVVDRWGNRVSATPSGGWLQSSPVVPGLGFALPTRAQMFWLEPGLPNSLAPGKRPRTTLSPAMVLDDDGSGIAFGTPGGDQQDQWTVPFLLRHLVGGAGLQAAIDAPMWHSTDVPGSFYPRTRTPRGLVAESRLGPDVLAALAARGHRVETVGPWELGRLSAAGQRSDGLLVAAANARGMQGYAVGR
ncbi:gamma-glutamyltransferase family protein [Cellulomonas fengjieae]|uniref:Gamma-glutamyltransferase n=1 Tax=Cellulomonas fengjieae TaxID=2819978 RepID=A0ABS3SBV3_9CELL|nr:gamma-glutamyltransferase [Cellulomonas fengjieae]MBO3083229.1 gamma-glutamyltransferase [Cellulomonas fengjieae]QVI65415.1 gamma-glutamyltransferase [Cellulomonas fengjieae]